MILSFILTPSEGQNPYFYYVPFRASTQDRSRRRGALGKHPLPMIMAGSGCFSKSKRARLYYIHKRKRDRALPLPRVFAVALSRAAFHRVLAYSCISKSMLVCAGDPWSAFSRACVGSGNAHENLPFACLSYDPGFHTYLSLRPPFLPARAEKQNPFQRKVRKLDTQRN